MKEYTITLAKATEIAQNTMQYDFRKPDDFAFTAGQYAILDCAGQQHTDDRPSFRSLSIASAPHEPILSFIMRHSESAFKKNMLALVPGDTITMKGPLGHMALPEDPAQPVMFIAAGVGITPVRAMIRHAIHAHLTNPICLLYANRYRASAACMDELTTCSLPHYECLNVMSNPTEIWDGLRGRIDAQMIVAHAPDIAHTQFYVIGTTGFVNAMKEALESLSVTKDQLHIDNFG